MPFSAEASPSRFYKSQNQHNIMNNAERVEFPDSKIRDEFFSSLKFYSGVKTWEKLYKKFNIDRSLFQRYRRGLFTLPGNDFQSFLEVFSTQEQKHFLSIVSTKSEGWGRSIAGRVTYSRYPEMFRQGRQKAIDSRNKKYRFDQNMPLSVELCEFIGALIGDGFTNNYGCRYITEYCGDNRFDKDYYDRFIIPFAKKQFKANARIRYRDNAMWINFRSKCLHEMLINRFSIPAGVKFDKVMIPDEIIDSTPELISSTIRGIFDTDGCVFFDKRKIYKEPYIRIALQLENPPLIRQVYRELLKLGVKAHLLKDNRRIQINGKEAVKEYLEKVGFSNKRHIDRILSFFPRLFCQEPPAN